MMTEGFKEQHSGKHQGVTTSFRVRQTWTGALGPSAVVREREGGRGSDENQIFTEKKRL